jgi:hypothetical protein
MRLVSALCLLVALGLATTAVFADPNHSEEKAWSVYLDPTRTEYAEDEANNDACPGQAIACADVITPAYLEQADRDWSGFYATAGTLITVGTDAVAGQPTVDTYVDLIADDCTTVLASDDDGGPGLYSLVSYSATYTGYYYPRVRGYTDSSIGYYKLFVNCAGAIENDTCAGAIPIDRCSAGSLQGDTSGANNDYDPGSGGCATGYPEAGKDVVYSLSLQAGDIVDMTYTQLNADTAFYIITDCADPAGSCVVGADATFTGEPEVIHYVAPAGGTYYLILDSYGAGSGGPWTLDYNIQCPGAPEGACCFADGSCQILSPDRCSEAGGNYLGDNTSCDDCPPVATETTTWGTIKANYR